MGLIDTGKWEEEQAVSEMQRASGPTRMLSGSVGRSTNPGLPEPPSSSQEGSRHEPPHGDLCRPHKSIHEANSEHPALYYARYY
jgi:hypothetical protein